MPRDGHPPGEDGGHDADADRAVELGAAQLMRGDYPDRRLAILTDPQGGQFGMLTW